MEASARAGAVWAVLGCGDVAPWGPVESTAREDAAVPAGASSAWLTIRSRLCLKNR